MMHSHEMLCCIHRPWLDCSVHPLQVHQHRLQGSNPRTRWKHCKQWPARFSGASMKCNSRKWVPTCHLKTCGHFCSHIQTAYMHCHSSALRAPVAQLFPEECSGIFLIIFPSQPCKTCMAPLGGHQVAPSQNQKSAASYQQTETRVRAYTFQILKEDSRVNTAA